MEIVHTGFGTLFIDVNAQRVSKYARNEHCYRESRNEQYILSRITPHANIVRSLDFVEDPRHGPVLVLAYGGASLHALIPYLQGDDGKCYSLFYQVRAALHHIHSHGIAHLDVKPENVVVDGWGCARLIDFGLSCESEHVEHRVGTRAYACPEMWWCADGVKKNAFAADAWSYGILVYVVYHQSLPWELAAVSDPRFARMAQAQTQGFAPSRHFGAVPQWLELDATLRIDPRVRFLPW